MATRFQVQKFTPDLVDATALLLADRHRRHRLACPALDPQYEDPSRCAPLIAERLEEEGALGAVAFGDEKASGYVLTTRRGGTWGPNAWAEDAGSAGDGEAVRQAYAAIAGDLVDAGRRGHWAVVPPSDDDLVEAWFSLSFGLQHVYAMREPVTADYEQSARPGLEIRRAESRDLRALAELDLVLPRHVNQSPVFSKVTIRPIEEVEAELAGDIDDPKYAIFVAEFEGRVISTLAGCSVDVSTTWTPTMRPRSAALLGYAATLPDARGLGAGRALTETYMAWARDEGYEWLVTDWRSTNLEANRTWRALGFRPSFYRLHRLIG